MPSKSTKPKPFNCAMLEANGEEMRTYLRQFAQDLAAEITSAAPERSDEVLSALIAELALSAADQRRRKERRIKQAQGIAAAKANGVRFGRRKAELPEDFEDSYQAWVDGQMSLRQAAKACGMVTATFQRAAQRRGGEQAAL